MSTSGQVVWYTGQAGGHRSLLFNWPSLNSKSVYSNRTAFLQTSVTDATGGLQKNWKLLMRLLTWPSTSSILCFEERGEGQFRFVHSGMPLISP